MTTPSWLNVKDYASFRDAMSAVPIGGATVYAPSGTYLPTTTPAFVPPLEFPTDRPVRLLGDGIGIRRLAQNINDASVDLIRIRGDDQSVANLSLLAAQQYGAGTGVGIRIWRSADPLSGPSNVVYRPRLINVEIARTQGWGLLVDDTSRNGQPQVCIGGLFEGLEIRDFQTAGIVGCTRGAVFLGKGGSRSLHFRGCNIKSFIGVGIRAKFVEDLSLKDCIVENGTGSCPLVDCEGCNHLAVRHCWFESISLGGVPFVRLYYGEYMSAVVEACTFRKKAQSPQPNDICAVQVDGVARGVHIAALELVIPGTASSGTGGHLRVTPASGLDPEALVGPCGLNDATPSSVAPRLRASIDSPRAGILNAAWRQRVLSITQQERDTLADLKPGDLIFNADAVRCEVFDGVSWRALW